MAVRHYVPGEPKQTRIVKAVKKLARRKRFSSEDVRSMLRKMKPGTLYSTLSKMRELGYIHRANDKYGEREWQASNLLKKATVGEICKATNKLSSLHRKCTDGT